MFFFPERDAAVVVALIIQPDRTRGERARENEKEKKEKIGRVLQRLSVFRSFTENNTTAVRRSMYDRNINIHRFGRESVKSVYVLLRHSCDRNRLIIIRIIIITIQCEPRLRLGYNYFLVVTHDGYFGRPDETLNFEF